MAHPRTAMPCDGLVISGGRGRRLGGRDKGLLPVGKLTAAEHSAALLRPLCRRVFISANRNLERYRTIADVTVLTDLRPDFPGPLAALEAVSAQPLAPLLLVLPNDLPLLTSGVPEALLEALRGADDALDIVYASDGTREQYLCACLRSRCLQKVAPLLDAGERRVRRWVDGLNTRALSFTGAEAAGLQNCNEAGDWVGLS